MERCPVPQVLRNFSLGEGFDEVLQHLARRVVGAGVMKRQPTVGILPANSLGATRDESLNYVEWRINKLTHKVNCCRIVVPLVCGGELSLLHRGVGRQPLADRLPRLIELLPPNRSQRPRFLATGEGIFAYDVQTRYLFDCVVFVGAYGRCAEVARLIPSESHGARASTCDDAPVADILVTIRYGVVGVERVSTARLRIEPVVGKFSAGSKRATSRTLGRSLIPPFTSAPGE
mmetsp:Transcript_23481/g.43435  ORF Transcript_23481/g.43435 Transcript_23481/m.43435 type:complete len:232 (+) Transcript_23481:685-1380(+)